VLKRSEIVLKKINIPECVWKTLNIANATEPCPSWPHSEPESLRPLHSRLTQHKQSQYFAAKAPEDATVVPCMGSWCAAVAQKLSIALFEEGFRMFWPLPRQSARAQSLVQDCKCTPAWPWFPSLQAAARFGWCYEILEVNAKSLFLTLIFSVAFFAVF
jgi:hypothetical protein